MLECRNPNRTRRRVPVGPSAAAALILALALPRAAVAHGGKPSGRHHQALHLGPSHWLRFPARTLFLGTSERPGIGDHGEFLPAFGKRFAILANPPDGVHLVIVDPSSFRWVVGSPLSWSAQGIPARVGDGFLFARHERVGLEIFKADRAGNFKKVPVARVCQCMPELLTSAKEHHPALLGLSDTRGDKLMLIDSAGRPVSPVIRLHGVGWSGRRGAISVDDGFLAAVGKWTKRTGLRPPKMTSLEVVRVGMDGKVVPAHGWSVNGVIHEVMWVRGEGKWFLIYANGAGLSDAASGRLFAQRVSRDGSPIGAPISIRSLSKEHLVSAEIDRGFLRLLMGNNADGRGEHLLDVPLSGGRTRDRQLIGGKGRSVEDGGGFLFHGYAYVFWGMPGRAWLSRIRLPGPRT